MVSQDELKRLDEQLERAYFAGLPVAVRTEVWRLHSELVQAGLVDRVWKLPVNQWAVA